MWPNSRQYVTPMTAPVVGSQPQPMTASMSSATASDILNTANSLRHLFGNNQSLYQSMGAHPPASRPDPTLSGVASRRPPDRHIIDYESPNYSRLDRSVFSPMSSTNSQPYSHSSTEPMTRIYDPTKMPQKSILKKTKEPSYEPPVHTIDDEDDFLYGDRPMSSGSRGSAPMHRELPPGIVHNAGHQAMDTSRERAATRSPVDERSLSPISLRLKREMENMQNKNQTRREPQPDEDSFWTPRLGLTAPRDADPHAMNEWEHTDEEELMYRRRHGMNPSPDQSMELERIRIQQMAAIQAGILQQSEKGQKRRDSPPSPRSKHRETSPKRMRRRTRSPSPRRRRSISPLRSRSPRRRSPSPRRRSPSPRRRSISPRQRRRSPSPRRRSPSPRRCSPSPRRRSRERSREFVRRTRSPSRSPPTKRRRSPEPSVNAMNLMNPMAAPEQGMAYSPHTAPPLNPLLGQYTTPDGKTIIMPRSMIPGPDQNYVFQAQYLTSSEPSLPPVVPTFHYGQHPTGAQWAQRSPARSVQNLKNVPIDKVAPKKPVEKKEDKLINPQDLLIAEKTRLKSKLEELKIQYYRKSEEQKQICNRDNGSKDSYAYKTAERVVCDIRHSMEETQKKLLDNIELTREVQNSKAKAKDLMEKVKEMGDISKVTPDMLKKKEPIKKLPKPVPQKSRSPERKAAKETVKSDKKEVVTLESEDEEKTSRFKYFDSGPHWCRTCDKFIDLCKNYFQHVHTKEHLTKQKESERTPWITKEYIRDYEKKVVKGKDQLMVASKGIQFIQPTQGFYCNLCNEFLHDSYQAQKHFKSAKHNRNYTRYTLQNSDYEHKWKVERDRAYTQMKKKEREQMEKLRELEDQQIRLEEQKRADEKKRVQEELKRKDRDLRERLEAMNKNQKKVKELDDSKSETKTDDKKEDKSKASPKGIRLNLSSKSKEKSKSPDKTKDRQNKSKTMGESGDNPDDIEDMLVIDEIHCDETMNPETKGTEDNIDENALLYPESGQNVSKADESVRQSESKSEDNVITIMDISGEEDKDKTEGRAETISEKIENDDKTEVEEEFTEGVLPSTEDNGQKNEINSEPNAAEDRPKEETNAEAEVITKEVGDHKNEEVNHEEIEGKTKPTQDNGSQEAIPEPEESGPNPQKENALSYAEVVAKGSEDNKETKEEKKSETDCKSDAKDNSGDKPKNGSDVTEEIEIIEVKAEDKQTKSSLKKYSSSDFDDDILQFEERLKNLESLANKEALEVEPEDDDPLDGFDVIDETK